jgi:hypothetical protein
MIRGTKDKDSNARGGRGRGIAKEGKNERKKEGRGKTR